MSTPVISPRSVFWSLAVILLGVVLAGAWVLGRPLLSGPIQSSPLPLEIEPLEASAARLSPPVVQVSTANPDHYRLFAVRPAGDQSSAIVAIGDGAQLVVSMGGRLSDGTYLTGVADDHIMLSTHAGVRRVTFRTEPPPPAAITAAGSNTPAATVRSRNGSEGPRASGDAAPFTSALRRNRGGEPGYVWRPGARLEALARAGLRPGDTLISMNDLELHDDARLQEMADELAMGRSVTIAFRREGRLRQATVTP